MISLEAIANDVELIQYRVGYIWQTDGGVFYDNTMAL
jgi:hypothetical protein